MAENNKDLEQDIFSEFGGKAISNKKEGTDPFAEFGGSLLEKKKSTPSQFLVTPSQLPKTIDPLQQGASIAGGGVLKEVSKGVPQSIGDGVSRDKRMRDNWLSSQWNLFSDMLASSVAGLTAFQQKRANVGLERAMQMSGETEERKKAIKQGFYKEGIEDVVRERVESKLRTPKSTKIEEKQRTEYDISDGVSMSDLGGILNSAPAQIANMGLGAVTMMTNYAGQIADESNEELKKSPEYNKLSESDKLLYMGSQMLTQTLLEKLPIDILTKKTGLSSTIKNAITNKVLKQFRERGLKASTQQLEAALTAEVSSFAKMVKRVGVGAAMGAIVEPTQEALQAATKEGVKLATNRLKDRQIFDENEVKKNFWKNVGNAAVAALPVGIGFGAGAARLNNTKKAIREEISKAVGEDGVQKSIQEINTQVESGNLTPQEAEALGGKVQEYAEIAGRIPQDLNEKTKYAIIGGIEQRNEVQSEIEKVKESSKGLDEAFLTEKESEIKVLEGKLGQINDYLEGIVNDRGLPEYVQEGDKFYKVFSDGRQSTKTEITKEHFDIAKLVKENEDKKRNQKAQTEEMLRPIDLDNEQMVLEEEERKKLAKQKQEEIQQPIEVSAKPKPIDEQSTAASQKWIKDLYSLPEFTRIQDKNGNVYDIKNSKIRKLTLDKEGNIVNAEIIHIDMDIHKRGTYANPDFFNEGYKVLPKQPIQQITDEEIQQPVEDKKAEIEKRRQEELDAVDVSKGGKIPIEGYEQYYKNVNEKYDAELKALEEQKKPIQQITDEEILDEKIQTPIEQQPELVESVRVEQEPEGKEGVKVVTLSGMEEGERAKAVEERKKKTTLTEKETLHNDLIDLANRADKARGNEKTNLQGQIRQRVRELNAKLGEELYKYDGVSVRAKVKSKTKGERYLKIKGTTRDTSGRAIKEDAVTLFDRSPELVEKYEQLAESPNITALQVDSGNGVTMTAEQIEAALQDIADGIPSVQADNLLNALEEGVKRGYFDLRGEAIGQKRIQAPIQDFIGVQQEEVGQPMDEDELQKYLEEQAELPIEEEEDLNDLINEYEQQPQQIDISGKIQSAKPESEKRSSPTIQPTETGKGEGKPKADVGKQPIGEAETKVTKSDKLIDIIDLSGEKNILGEEDAEDVKKLLEVEAAKSSEKVGDILSKVYKDAGYHRGSLSIKSDYLQRGYIGDMPFTGYYFIGNPNEVVKGGSRYGDPKAFRVVDFSQYNLIKPTTNEYWALKSGLKRMASKLADGESSDSAIKLLLNNNLVPSRVKSAIRQFSSSEGSEIATKIAKLENLLETVKNNRDYNAINKEIEILEKKAKEAKDNPADFLQEIFDEWAKIPLGEGKERFETYFLKSIGFEGVDVRGLKNENGEASPDSFSHGSVIFDLKPNTSTSLHEAYFKAKKDGSNPELVKAVEDLLGKPKEQKAEQPKTPLEEEYEKINKTKGEKAKELAKQKLISDNFDSIVAQLMTKNKIKRQC